MTWFADAAKAEYSVTDMTVEPNVTYFFDKRKRLMAVYLRTPGEPSKLATRTIPDYLLHVP